MAKRKKKLKSVIDAPEGIHVFQYVAIIEDELSITFQLYDPEKEEVLFDFISSLMVSHFSKIGLDRYLPENPFKWYVEKLRDDNPGANILPYNHALAFTVENKESNRFDLHIVYLDNLSID